MQSAKQVFLNVPFDEKFEPLFVAYVVGLTALGFQPRSVLEVAPNANAWSRLDRLSKLIAMCDVSVHDLSRVQLSRRDGLACPRFNMPFELGLAVALAKHKGQWRVFESKPYRLQHSLSDLNGFDPYIHDGTVRGVFRELLNAFPKHSSRLPLPTLMAIHHRVRKAGEELKRGKGAASLFSASQFKDIATASALATQRTLTAPT